MRLIIKRFFIIYILTKTYDKVDKYGKELSYDDIAIKTRDDITENNNAFKHTFLKNKTGYYWYSTEFIEEE